MCVYCCLLLLFITGIWLVTADVRTVVQFVLYFIVEFYKSPLRSYGFVPRGQTYTDDQTHGHFLKFPLPKHQSATPIPLWAPSHDAQQKWRFFVGSAVTDASSERCALECKNQTVHGCWICRQYNLPKRPEPLAQHSHTPRQTNRLTTSNIAEGEPSNQNLNKRSNQPNERTVIHVNTPHTRTPVRLRVQISPASYCLQQQHNSKALANKSNDFVKQGCS